jgi:hypothetical protein
VQDDSFLAWRPWRSWRLIVSVAFFRDCVDFAQLGVGGKKLHKSGLSCHPAVLPAI